MIDIRDYDIAMLQRIKLIFDNTHWIQRPNIPIKDIRDRKVLDGNDISFPIITLRRTNCPIISQDYNSWSRANTGNQYKPSIIKESDPATYDKLNGNGLEIVNSTFSLTYYIDVISFERDNFDTIVVELQENLLKMAYVHLDNIKSDNHIDKLIPGQSCHLLLEEVEDTSDLDNFDSGNALYRATLTVKLNAYIYRKCVAHTIETIKVGVDVETDHTEIIK